MNKDFPPGTRVKLIGWPGGPLKGATGTIIDPKNPPVPSRIPIYAGKNDLYFLPDDRSLVPPTYNYSPYLEVYGETSFEKISETSFSEGKDFLPPEKITTNNDVCPSCGGHGEYINGATKCEACWLVW